MELNCLWKNKHFVFPITVITGKYFGHNPVLAGAQILFDFHMSRQTNATIHRKPVVRNELMLARNGESLTSPLVAKELARAVSFHSRDGTKVHPTMSVEISQLTLYQGRVIPQVPGARYRG